MKNALHCIAEQAKGETIECSSINDALNCIAEHAENLIGGDRTAEAITITENGVTNTPSGKFYDPITVNVPADELKYHLYAWDYANGEVIAYSEKELPQAGDVVFLKEDMEGGKITDPTELKLIYHVVSDADGVITVSEHPEGETGGYTFNRNEADDYEEEVTDVRDMVDITLNGFLMSQKGTMFKGANVNVNLPNKLYAYSCGTVDSGILTPFQNPTEGEWFYMINTDKNRFQSQKIQLPNANWTRDPSGGTFTFNDGTESRFYARQPAGDITL